MTPPAILRQLTRAGMIDALDAAEPEPVISREEVVATMLTLTDIATDVNAIRGLLEADEEEEEQEGTD